MLSVVFITLHRAPGVCSLFVGCLHTHERLNVPLRGADQGSSQTKETNIQNYLLTYSSSSEQTMTKRCEKGEKSLTQHPSPSSTITNSLDTESRHMLHLQHRVKVSITQLSNKYVKRPTDRPTDHSKLFNAAIMHDTHNSVKGS